jgi:uncharacterized protein (TIGR02246 family)
MTFYLLAGVIMAASAASGGIAAFSEAQSAAVSPIASMTRRPDCPAVTPAEIESQFAAFSAAWTTGDPDRVTALFSSRPVLLATVSDEPRVTREGVHNYFVGFLSYRPEARIDTSRIDIDCRTASRVGTWTVTLKNPTTGETTSVRARYSFIYRYEEGAWKIDHLHSSRMPQSQ